MSEQAKNSLSLFMKKQISEKSSKNNVTKNSAAKIKNAKSSAKDKKDGEQEKDENENPEQEEMTEEEELEEAKKASKNKAAEQDQTEMFKKLILENIVKYTVIIAVMVMFAIGVIEFGPALFELLNGLIFKVLMGALKK